jgi:uncharacterized membrane protein
LYSLSGEVSGKPPDAGNTEPIVVEILGGGLCSVVGVVWLIMMIAYLIILTLINEKMHNIKQPIK